MMGAIFDRSCLVWQEWQGEGCDDRGSCWLYNPEDLARGLFLMVLISKSIAVVCHVLSIFLYKAPPEEEEDDVIKDGNIEKNKSESNGYVNNVHSQKEMAEKAPKRTPSFDEHVSEFFGRDETITKL